MVFLNPVPEKARFITDYVVVTNGEGGAVNTALACILFFGDIFPLLVENRSFSNILKGLIFWLDTSGSICQLICLLAFP